MAHSHFAFTMNESQILSSVNEQLESSLTHGYNITKLSSRIEPLPDVVNGGSIISNVPEKAMEVKLAITAELQSLKQELGEKGHPSPQDEELLSALKEQVTRLMQREQSLEQRLETVCKENAELRDSVSSLYAQLALHEQESNMQTQQLTEAWQEMELAKDRVQDLQSQIEELQEEVSLQRTTDGDTSLLSEMEHSLDSMNWIQDKKQVIQEVSAILDMLLPVSYGSEAPSNQEDSLQGRLGQLKSVAERIVHNETLQELNRPIVGGDLALCENTAWIQELRDQNAQLLKENAELRLKADSRLDEEIIQRAIKDRDDAISKKTAVEAELVRSRNDMMYLNNQLLEAIQRKLELSQELEAWQDDIQVIINQQLKSQTEQQMQSKRSGGNRLSFFRKPLKASTSVSCIPETTTVPNRSPWRNWLKVAK